MKQLKEQQKAAAEEARIKRAAQQKKRQNRNPVETFIDQVGKTTQRQISYQIGKSITRSILGVLFGKK